MAFLIAIAFALLAVVLTNPVPARAALISGMTPAQYADMPNVPVKEVKATTTPITTAKAQPVPVKTVKQMTEAEQRALIAELIRQIQALIIQLQKQQSNSK